MRILLSLVLIAISFNSFATNTSIIELRNLYYRATTDELFSQKFLKVFERLDINTDPVLKGYKGVAEIVSAKYFTNPYNKWNAFRHGKELLENAISADTANIELRFLRFCIQTNIPAILCYYQEKKEDKKYLIRKYSAINDTDLKLRVHQYLWDHGNCSRDEKIILHD